MLAALLAVLPVFLLIFLGHLCRRREFPGEGFWAPAERLTYYLLFPALLTATLARADFSTLEVAPMAAAVALAILAMSVVALAVKPLLAVDGPGFTSVYQGCVRLNTYIGLSIALALYGEAGLAAVSVVVAVFVPLVNLLSVAMLARFAAATPPTPGGLARQVAGNPLILACLLGILLNVTGLGLPPVVGAVLEVLGRAALPLGLLAVGAALDLAALRASGRVTLAASGLKLVVHPVLAGLAVWGLGVGGISAFAAVMFCGLPVATSAYILARQLGGDAPLMASITTVQTLLSMVTLPVVVALLL